MDAQLQELLESIKKEGIETAKQESERIIEDARKEAAQIVADAETQGKTIVEKAKNEAARLEATAKDAIRQAGRDLVLSLESQIGRIFERIVRETVSATYDEKVLQDAIVGIVSAFPKAEAQDLEVLLSKDDLDRVESSLRGRLGQAIGEGVEIAIAGGLDSGFRLSEKEGQAYYDFSAEGIAEALSAYLNPRLASLIRGESE
ncbi:MAG: V-type ATP synthase subunit E [Spirochaetaceae bacterium]